MINYDANKPPKPVDWLKYPDKEKIKSIRKYYYSIGIELSDYQVQGILFIENQIAFGGNDELDNELGVIINDGFTREKALVTLANTISQEDNSYTTEPVDEPEWLKKKTRDYNFSENLHQKIWNILFITGLFLIFISVLSGIYISASFGFYETGIIQTSGIFIGIAVIIQGTINGFLMIGFSQLGTSVNRIEKFMSIFTEKK